MGQRTSASGARPVGTDGQQVLSPEILYVVRRGWHVEVAFAAVDVQPPLTAVLAEFPGASYLSIGFGDRHYLVSKHKNSPPSLLLALWPGDGLMLTTGLGATPQRAFGDSNVIELRLTAEQMRAAQSYVGDTIAFRDGEPQVETERPYEGGLFMAATRRYSAANTCNTWAAKVLKAAGLPVRVGGVALAGQVWSQAKRVAKATGSPETARHPQPRDLRLAMSVGSLAAPPSGSPF